MGSHFDVGFSAGGLAHPFWIQRQLEVFPFDGPVFVQLQPCGKMDGGC